MQKTAYEKQESTQSLHKHSSKVHELTSVIQDLRMQNELLYADSNAQKALSQTRESELTVKLSHLSQVFLITSITTI